MKKLVLLLAATLLSAGAFAQSTPVATDRSEVNAISTQDTVSRQHRRHHKHHVRHVVRR